MYRLPPRISPIIQEALSNTQLLYSGMESHGSPLNMLFPQNFSANVDGFNAVIKKHDIDAKIFYAHKPNKSPIFIKEAKSTGIGVDVSSKKELKNALENNIPKKAIEATGPKSETFLHTCLQEGVIINIDAIYELDTILTLAEQQQKHISIVIRLSGFSSEFVKIATRFERFGIDIANIDTVLQRIANNSYVQLLGFSFHFNNDNHEQRVVAITNILQTIIHAKSYNINCNVIDIGGGFEVQLINDEEAWEKFIMYLKKSITDRTEKVSFNGTTYDYKYDGKAISGNFSLPSPYKKYPKETFLDKLLSTVLPNFENRTIAQILNELAIELWIEPGQGLLDQCGITLMRIIGVKEKNNERIIFVEGNNTNLWSNYELFTDPILISKQDKGEKDRKGYFISGNLCLGLDMIMNHKVFLPNPQAGDILAFVNTAAYRMDFVESPLLQNPIAKKVVYHDGKVTLEQNY